MVVVALRLLEVSKVQVSSQKFKSQFECVNITRALVYLAQTQSHNQVYSC
jgi:hypothetical protein